VKGVWFVDILFGFFTLVLPVFTGVCFACLDLFGVAPFVVDFDFFAPALVPFVYGVEVLVNGAEVLVPGLLEIWLDKVSENMINYTYGVANVLADQDNYNAAEVFLRREAGRASGYAYVLPGLADSSHAFFLQVPEFDEMAAGLYLPVVFDSRDWFVKLLLNVLPLAKMSYGVSSMVAPNGLPGLWFLMVFDCSY